MPGRRRRRGRRRLTLRPPAASTSSTPGASSSPAIRSSTARRTRSLDVLLGHRLVLLDAFVLRGERGGDGEALLEAVDHARVDVGAACDRRRVAEERRDLVDRCLHESSARGARRCSCARTASATAHSAVAFQVRKSFAREVAAGRLLEVRVHVLGLHVDPAGARAGFAERQQLAAAAAPALQRDDHRPHVRVPHALHAPHAVLGGEVEQQPVALDAHVRLAQRRQPVRLVLRRVVLAADAEQADVEQPRRRTPARAPRRARPPRRPRRRDRARRAAAAPAARARTRPSRRTSPGRAVCASRRGSGTACARRRRCPVAWMWPRGSRQIHTSRQAGGIASARMRSIVASSVTRAPSAST